ncbi:hypothetical protein FA13DRAFT_1791687 [Coprinellus micaceus]|uniref:Uncharacterized protein n=1 Tax=Coprinellus micaceus TaxID=71717 RepID=A0A4Y7TD08_COPMI|nr:hypothetical protein FA13DRAFT_1791687 [Coprinellus micaceus]
MKFSATTSYSLLAFTAFVLAKEVTLYHPVVTRSSGASYYSLTGDLTVKPISTATDGRTAYEVQQTITGLEEDVFLADETQYERVETLTASGLPGLVTINDLKCTKDDDGTMFWALAAVALQPSAAAEDVTFYSLSRTTTIAATQTRATGSIEVLSRTFKPVSTLADGRTAYELNEAFTEVALVYPAGGPNEGPSTTTEVASSTITATWTVLADATRYEISDVRTLIPDSSDSPVFNSSLTCTRKEDGTMVCERRQNIIDPSRPGFPGTTMTEEATITGVAVPYYTLIGSSSARSVYNTTAVLMVALTGLGTLVGWFLVL